MSRSRPSSASCCTGASTTSRRARPPPSHPPRRPHPLPSHPPARRSLQALLAETRGGEAPRPWLLRWLDVLKAEGRRGFKPAIPEFGLGDATSLRLLRGAAEITHCSGAVRHAAECFNFYFPQPLDEQYLVLWSGFAPQAWAYLDEPALRAFLVDRVADGFRRARRPPPANRPPAARLTACRRGAQLPAQPEVGVRRPRLVRGVRGAREQRAQRAHAARVAAARVWPARADRGDRAQVRGRPAGAQRGEQGARCRGRRRGGPA